MVSASTTSTTYAPLGLGIGSPFSKMPNVGDEADDKGTLETACAALEESG
ncbi:hypothetical protein EGYY_22090 [Eggerthella sp. YY7918]|nr:hypothetical protein EGYY_22090 [Eggerthella sp. YY7918]